MNCEIDNEEECNEIHNDPTLLKCNNRNVHGDEDRTRSLARASFQSKMCFETVLPKEGGRVSVQHQHKKPCDNSHIDCYEAHIAGIMMPKTEK